MNDAGNAEIADDAATAGDKTEPAGAKTKKRKKA